MTPSWKSSFIYLNANLQAGGRRVWCKQYVQYVTATADVKDAMVQEGWGIITTLHAQTSSHLALHVMGPERVIVVAEEVSGHE